MKNAFSIGVILVVVCTAAWIAIALSARGDDVMPAWANHAIAVVTLLRRVGYGFLAVAAVLWPVKRFRRS